jgi:GT2 family glycosyltransferase/glycosyltransferase involved in cell wall biosynthesis
VSIHAADPPSTRVRDVLPGAALEPSQADVVVCIPLHGAHQHFTRCLRSVLDHTAPDVSILIADDAGPDPASRAWVERLDREGALRHDVLWLRQPDNLGFVGNVNRAFEATAPHDVVLLNSDCAVAEGWLEGLQAAARSDSQVATATALTNSGTIVSVPYRNHGLPALPQDLTLEEAARRVRAGSPRLRPRIPTAIGHCVYIRRSALDLVGGFDEAFAPAYGEEVDFSQRCLLRGLQHVVADDVFVFHAGGASLGVGGEPSPLQDAHERMLGNRYPYYQGAVKRIERDETGPLARTLRSARRALLGPSVTVDARCLTRFLTGTQLHALELIHSLWRTESLHLRVILPAEPGDYALEALGEMRGIDVGHAQHVSEDTGRSDVVHRPFQVTSADDLQMLRRLGERIVITHQDLIAYRNPGYHSGHAAWERQRRLTRQALALADVVLFFSAHAAADAMADDLVSPNRTRVVPIGVDHRLASLRLHSMMPTQAGNLADCPYLLCLGTDFRHKNRVFALELLAALQERHGWEGRLVLAGPRVAHGSSAGEEAEWLALHPRAAEAVAELPAVNEAEKAWLYEHATAVVYPTTYEGFGLVPFEAADFGAPCLFAPVASLPEVLPTELALLVPWNAATSADRAIDVLRDPAQREALLAGVRKAAHELSWDRAASRIVAVYDQAALTPTRAAGELAQEAVRLDHERGSWEGRYWHLHNLGNGTAMSLIGPDHGLPENAQRALAALASRPMTRGLLLGTLRTIHRAGRIWGSNSRRGTRPPVDESTRADDAPAATSDPQSA